MPAIQIPSATTPPIVVDRPKYRVFLRRDWGDSWQQFDYLECIDVSFAAGPSIDRGSFLYLSGEIKREDKSAFAFEQPRDFSDYFVRVQLIMPAVGGQDAQSVTVFVGRFYEDSYRPGGDAAGGESDDQGGIADDHLVAFGLVHELDRIPIVTSYIVNDEATSSDTGIDDEGTTSATGGMDGTGDSKPGVITRPLVFNEHYIHGFREIGNRSGLSYEQDAGGTKFKSYAFGNAGKTWSASNILHYLFKYFQRDDFQFMLGGLAEGGKDGPLENLVIPRVDLGKKTVKQALDELVDRRRGLGWTVRVTENDENPGWSGSGNATSLEIFVYSIFNQDVKTGDQTIPANADIKSIDLSGLRSPKDVQISVNTLARYGTIIVSGEPLVCCFTVSFNDATLIKGWTDDQESAYKGVSSTINGTGPNGITNDMERATDKFHNIYTHYTISSTWNWLAGDGSVSGSSKPDSAKHEVVPLLNDDGSFDPKIGALSRNWGHTLIRNLPLRKAGMQDSYQPEFREPFALAFKEVSVSGESPNNCYVYVDDPGDGESSGGSVRMLDTEFGIEVRMSPRHQLARNHWSGATASSLDIAFGNEKYDYTKIVATVAVRADQRLQVIDTITDGDPDRVLHIDVPDAEMWYIVPGTVIDVKNGQLNYDLPAEVDQSTRLARDDSKRLRTICALAKCWYGTKRSILDLTIEDIWLDYQIGNYLTSVSSATVSEDINGVVTEITLNLKDMTTRIQASYGELDFVGPRQELPRLSN
jgi:hypothetical protein